MATELHAFFDKDVFIKLACCDLWEDALEALGVTYPYRLVSATPTGSKTALRRMDIPDSLREAAKARLATMAIQVPVVPVHWASTADRRQARHFGQPDDVLVVGVDGGRPPHDADGDDLPDDAHAGLPLA